MLRLWKGTLSTLRTSSVSRQAPRSWLSATTENGGSHDDFASKVKTPDPSKHINDRIKEHLSANNVVVYMKGSPSAPSCGFSWKTVQILDALDIPYASHDVLKDAEIRSGIKNFTGWPTIPQVFIGKEFVGGSDIVEQMARAGELKSMYDKTVQKESEAGSRS